MIFFLCLPEGRCEPVPKLSYSTPSTWLAMNGTFVTYTCVDGHVFYNQETMAVLLCDGLTWNISTDMLAGCHGKCTVAYANKKIYYTR